jgi:UPF0176 protein
MPDSKYLILAYYSFIAIQDPYLEVQRHKNFFENRDVTGRIYLSHEGINGQMSGIESDVEDYMKWLKSDPRFSEIPFKIHSSSENIFPRMTVKYRKQLVALDYPVDINNRGEHLAPSDWKKQLESEEEFILLDVRNDYEWEVGHFEQATLPQLETFRDFPLYADQLKERVDPKETKVLMYCTGGIRCELYSALLKEKGFEKVYQLEGGILNYGLKEGGTHWKGKVFVFDDRLAIPIQGAPSDSDESSPISHCCHCHLPSDRYYNCANMDCNKLFLACPSCLETYQGCCQYSCQQAPRLRPFQKDKTHKPFRRQHLI